MRKSDLARIVAVHMDLGHLRAAFPLRRLSEKDIIVWGSRRYAAPGEKKYWRAIRKAYYFLSRIGSYPGSGEDGSQDNPGHTENPAFISQEGSKFSQPGGEVSRLFDKKGRIMPEPA